MNLAIVQPSLPNKLCQITIFFRFLLLGLAAASGLSATMLLTHLVKSGEHIVCMDDVYGGT